LDFGNFSTKTVFLEIDAKKQFFVVRKIKKSKSKYKKCTNDAEIQWFITSEISNFKQVHSRSILTEQTYLMRRKVAFVLKANCEGEKKLMDAYLCSREKWRIIADSSSLPSSSSQFTTIMR
jgi:hypothetical protein